MIDGYMIALGFHRGEDGDPAFQKCAEEVMKFCNEKGLIPQGGVSVVMGVDINGTYYLVSQALILPKATEAPARLPDSALDR